MRRIRSKTRLAHELARVARSFRDGLVAGGKRNDSEYEIAEGTFLSLEEYADTRAQFLIVRKFIAFLLRVGALLDAEQIDAILHASGPFRFSIDESDPGCRDTLLEVQSILEAVDVGAAISPISSASILDTATEFAESFLAAYNAAVRKTRGAYYTPRALADFVIGSVDDVLCREFSLQFGLADLTSRAQLVERIHDERGIQVESGDVPFVQILDPAAGTGVFLSSAIRHIHRRCVNRWRSEADNSQLVSQRWRDFVRNRLPDMVHGYELLPATAAIANLLIHIQLAFTGCPFDRQLPKLVRVANPLVGDPCPEKRTPADVDRFSIIVGNPPFSAVSANHGLWIDGLLRGTMPDGRRVAGYFEVDGQPLAERKTWLQDDYVKFIRYAQWLIQENRAGVLAFVTNHGYLDNPTFRGMRQSLLTTFSHVHITDLHGSVKKHETGNNGVRDENVFPIEQGIAVGVFVKTPGGSQQASVRHGEIWGRRSDKLRIVATSTTRQLAQEQIAPRSPNYFFYPRDDSLQREYERGFSLKDVMPMNGSAVVTARDSFVVGFTRDEVIERMRVFRDSSISDDAIRTRFFNRCRSSKYPPGDTRGWKLPEARRRVAGDPLWESRLQRCQYRAFDWRWIYWTDWMIDWPRPNLTAQVIDERNWLLVARRQMLRSQPCNFFWVSDTIAVDGIIRSDNRGNESLFPLFTYDRSHGTSTPEPRANFSQQFIRSVRQSTGLKWSESSKGDDRGEFGPSELFQYIYAVFFSDSYRRRYADFLRIEFPRVFVPNHVDLFQQLARWGGELIDWHCLQARGRRQSNTRFQRASGGARIESPYPVFRSRKIYINPEEWFEPIDNEPWEFLAGAHQVCRKWLRDRRGRRLSDEDVETYIGLVTSVQETLRIMDQIDGCIEVHGGWPKAFVGRGSS